MRDGRVQGDPHKAGFSNQSGWDWAGGTQSGQLIYMNVDLLNPQIAKYTRMSASMAFQTHVGTGTSSGIHAVATGYTGLTIAPTSGTITGGTIYVYGYGTS